MIQNHIETQCPHSHKASLLLDDGDMVSAFLSKHVESCKSCRTKVEELKNSRAEIVKQIPFSTAPVEVRELFRTESRDLSNKVKKRIRTRKMKRIEELSGGIKMFARDLKTSLLSKQFIFSLAIVGTSWAYYQFFN